jgi:hypothetical protein
MVGNGMRQEAQYFEGSEPRLIYIAKRLSDATRLESILTASGIDYGVEADHYQGGVVFKSLRVGAFFYVLPEAHENAVAILLDHGYVPAK